MKQKDQEEATYQWVRRTPIGDLIKLEFSQLQHLQQRLIGEQDHVRKAKGWVEWAIRLKRTHRAAKNLFGRS